MNFPQGEVVPRISAVWRGSAVPIPSSVEQGEARRLKGIYIKTVL